MAIDADFNTKSRKSIIESTSTSGQPARAVVNPDGSNVGSSSVDQSTFTTSSTTGNIMQGVYQATPDTIADGKTAAIRISNNRAVKTDQDTYIFGEDPINNAMMTRARTGWTVIHAPAANTAATASKAAGATGVKHVARGIIVSCSAGASAPTAIQLTWNLRDGSTGAGTVLATGVIGIEAVAGKSPPPVQLSNLWIEGTAATAMTLEFTAAGGANTIEAVTLMGEDIS